MIQRQEFSLSLLRSLGVEEERCRLDFVSAAEGERFANAGDTLVVLADCATFEKDAREWCQKMNKVLLVFRDDGAAKRCEVRI
jgi:TusA-related sulfurtransferase